MSAEQSAESTSRGCGHPRRGAPPVSTVGRARSIVLKSEPDQNSWSKSGCSIFFGDALDYYSQWDTPDVIISDGGYGVLGFEGDTSDHLGLPDWYEPHIAAWSKAAGAHTTLWFWNSEIGWAAVQPVLEKYGWRYQNANVWNKGLGHIAGNINTQKIRRFPVVTELCVQYVFEARINDLPLKKWLLSEWKRSGLALKKANEACGVADAAVRKYLDQTHLWYFPPPEMFEKLCQYANTYGKVEGRPYFSIDGKIPASADVWKKMRTKFKCPHGVTNVWDRNPVNGSERIIAPTGRAVHLNQKPLDLMRRLIEASTDEGEVVWEPFGGLFTASLAAKQLKRKSFSAEIDSTYFQFGLQRLEDSEKQIQ